MKKIIYSLMAVAAAFALGSCNPVTEETPKPQDDTPVFEVDDLEAIRADAGTFTVGVTTNIEFTVEIPEEITWLRYVETKSAAPEAGSTLKKEVKFDIDLNEEDEMRQAEIKFLDSKGELLKKLTVIQRAGAGIDFEIQEPADVPVEGATVTLTVTSNVPFTGIPEVEWITVKSATASSVVLEVASNDGVDARDGKVNFVREGTQKIIGFVTLHQMEPNVRLINGEEGFGFATIAEAMEKYNTMTSGSAELILAKGTHTGNIVVAEGKIPLTVNGNGVAKLDGSVEIQKVAVTVKNLEIAPDGGVKPTFTTELNYEFGIFVHNAGYGAVIDNVTIDMKNLPADATGIFLVSGAHKTNPDAQGTEEDYVRNCIIDGGSSGHRLMQIYTAKATLTGNTFMGPYSSYAIRIGYSGCKVLLAGNKFEGTAACAVHFNDLTNSEITIGNGTRDTNDFEEFTGLYYKANSNVTAPAGANTFAPDVFYVTTTGEVSLDLPENAGIYLNRVWAKYNGSTGEWDDEIVPNSSNNNWNRNGVIAGDYVYVPICGASQDKYGVAVFELMTGEYLTTIKTGFKQEGAFWTSGIAKLAANDGSDVVYVCNLAVSSNDKSQDLVIYRLIEPDGDDMYTRAEEAARYTVPAGERYGDKMTSYGANEDGLLLFLSYAESSKSNANYTRRQIEFRATAGVINSAVDNENHALAGQLKNVIGGLYILSAQSTGLNATRQAIYGSNLEMRFVVGWWWYDTKNNLDPGLDQWYNCRIDQNKEWGEDPGSILTNVGYYDDCCLDPCLFFVDGIRHLTYTVVKMVDVGQEMPYSSGYVRVVRCPDAAGTSGYGMFDALWAVRDDASAFQKYPIGDPDNFDAVGNEATNKTGYCDIAYRGNDVYILSGITSTGMSLFKVMK